MNFYLLNKMGGSVSLLRRLLPIKFTDHTATADTRIWRESALQNHKVTDEFLDDPMELSNAYFLKTLEKRLATLEHNSLSAKPNKQYPGFAPGIVIDDR